MPDSAVAVSEVEAAPVPLGALDSLTDYRSRRGEAEEVEAQAEADKPAVEAVGAEPDAASAAGKALAAKKGSLQSRIDEITREKHSTAAERDAARAEASALRAELAALKAGKPTDAKPEAPKAEPTSAKPVVESFATLDEYFEALADWKLEQRDAAAAAAAKAKEAESAKTAADQSLAERAQAWIARRDAFAATNEEFGVHAMPFLEHLTAGTPMGDAILDSEVGPQVALYLGKNPDEAKRIAGLPWPAQIRAIGKIESKFDASAEETPKAPPVSKAPAPVKVPATGAPEAAAAPDPKNITSIKAWQAVRKNY